MTQRLKDGTILRMMDDTKKIKRGLIGWTFLVVAAIITLINPATHDNPLLFYAGIIALIPSLVAIALNIIAVNGIERHTPPTPATVTYNGDASDTLNEAHTPAPATIIEVTSGNTILRSSSAIQPDYHTFGALADALEANGWRWSRDRALKKSGCYKNLTARYDEITREMIHLRLVKGRPRNYRVTLMGQSMFIGESDNLFLEHMVR